MYITKMCPNLQQLILNNVRYGENYSYKNIYDHLVINLSLFALILTHKYLHISHYFR